MTLVQLKLNKNLTLKKPPQAYRTRAFRSLHLDEGTVISSCEKLKDIAKTNGVETIGILKGSYSTRAENIYYYLGQLVGHYFIGPNSRIVVITDQTEVAFNLLCIPIAFASDPQIGASYNFVIKRNTSKANVEGLLLKATLATNVKQVINNNTKNKY